MWRRVLPHLRAGPGSRAGGTREAGPGAVPQEPQRSAPAGARNARGPRHRPPAGTARSLREAAGSPPGGASGLLRCLRRRNNAVEAGWLLLRCNFAPGSQVSCASKLRFSSGFPELDPLLSFLKSPFTLCYLYSGSAPETGSST